MDFIMTLVADRRTTALSTADIDTALALSEGRRDRTLSAEEAEDIACTRLSAERFETIRAALASRRIDVLMTPADGRRKQLLVADMDSTMVANETLDDIAAHAEALRPGVGEDVAAVTRRSMNGEIDFATALRDRVAVLAGLPSSLLEEAWGSLRLNEDARTLVATMNAHGARTALVSGGFTFFTARVAKLCGFSEHHANRLVVTGDQLDGTVEDPILGPDAKLAQLRRLLALDGRPDTAALAIGDGANDLPMLRAAGLGLAFHAKPVVRQEIANRIDYTSLRTALFAQGYAASDFVLD
ncbi:phosphoserine phosphatase [Acetobacter nitrogenifigens DSM 23921 = NBRC 105050]|nr:phosphoserine phosphatase [Acetobacter nitrogenifigens DSM 23921 = NBRC 105050]